MTQTMTNGIRAGAAAACAAAALVLGGCTAEPGGTGETSATSPQPTIDPSASASASAAAAAAADEAALPMPPDEIRDWAQGAVPGNEVDGHLATFSGWISENSAPNQRNTLASADPGEYVVTIACRGEGTVTLSMRTADDEPVDEDVVCANSTIAFDRASSEVGLGFRLSIDGPPVIYAVSLQKVA